MAVFALTILMTGPEAEVAPARVRHLEHLRALRRSGRLRAAGEFAGGEGYLELIEAVDRVEAESVVRSSPLVADGLATWMLREWTELAL